MNQVKSGSAVGFNLSGWLGRTSSGTVSSDIWSWIWPKLHSECKRVETVHGSDVLIGTVDRRTSAKSFWMVRPLVLSGSMYWSMDWGTSGSLLVFFFHSSCMSKRLWVVVFRSVFGRVIGCLRLLGFYYWSSHDLSKLLFSQEAESRLFLASQHCCGSVRSWELNTKVISRWDCLNGIYLWFSYDHVIDGRMIYYCKVNDICDSFGYDWNLNRPESQRRCAWKIN